MFACVFPGQGSQHLGMGIPFYENFEAARHALEWASDHVNLPLQRWLEESTDAEMQDTERTQLLLFVVSHMIINVVEKELGKPLPCDHMAGHSLGEYTALYASRVWKAEDVLTLVRKRGIAMKHAAAKASNNGMMAVLGMPAEDIAACLNKTQCVVANDNCPGQVVLSGDTEGLTQLQTTLKEAGAKRCLILPVSGAFHSPFMAAAAKEMEPFLLNTPAHTPTCKVWMNITAQPLNEPVGPMMMKQITQGVKWRESVEGMTQAGVSTFIEMGAGRVLTQLNQRSSPDAQHLTLNDPSQLDDILKILA